MIDPKKMETITAKMLSMMVNDISLALLAISRKIAPLLPENLYQYAVSSQFAIDDMLGIIPFIRSGSVSGMLKDFQDRKIVATPPGWDEDNISDFEDVIRTARNNLVSPNPGDPIIDLTRLKIIHPALCAQIVQHAKMTENQITIPITGYENADRYKTISPLVRMDGQGIWVRDYSLAHLFARHILKIRSFEYTDASAQQGENNAMDERPPEIEQTQPDDDHQTEKRNADMHRIFSNSMLNISDTMFLIWMTAMAMREDNLSTAERAVAIYESTKTLFGRPLSLLAPDEATTAKHIPSGKEGTPAGGILEALQIYTLGAPPSGSATAVREDDFTIDDDIYRTYLLENLQRFRSQARAIIKEYDANIEKFSTITMPIIHEPGYGYTSPLFISDDRAVYFPNVGTAFLYTNAEMGQPNIVGRIQEDAQKIQQA